MSTDAGSVRVSIFNQSYSLRAADGDGEHVLRVARIVDERMRAVADGLAVHDVAKVAVITALNLADELEGLKNFYESELRDMLARAREEAEAAPAPDAEPEGPESPEEFEEPRPPFAEAREAYAESREQLAEAREPYAAQSDEGDARAATQEEPSWFDAIFDDMDTSPSKTGDERLSSQVASRLRSQVSARLRRLRQPSPGNITEGENNDER